MRWFSRRRAAQPDPAQIAALLRDFTDLTGFSTGLCLGSSMSAHAALRKHGGWLGIAVRPVVDRIAGLEWQALNDAGEEIEKSPLLELLRSPNAMCGGSLFLRILSQSLVLAGEAYALKMRGRQSGRVVQLHPISPDRVERVWSDSGELTYHVAPGSGSGEPEVYQAEDLLRVWRPLPSDPWEPYGAASMLVHEVEAETGWRQSVRRWFETDARPQLALELQAFDADRNPRAMGPEWFEEFASTWAEIYRRRSGSMLGVPAVLPAGSTLKELSGVGESENIGPTEQALRSKILSALGVPPFLLGAAHEANRASAEASLWAFDFSAVRPWVELLVCAVNHQLGPDFEGQRVAFREWIWRDRLAESEIDSKLLEHFVVSPNEVREKRNLPPAEWGDLPVSQAQDVPFDGTRRPEAPEVRSFPVVDRAARLGTVLDAAREGARLLSQGGDVAEWRAVLARVASMSESEQRDFRALMAARYFPSIEHDPEGAAELCHSSFVIQAEQALGETGEGE